jgi:hypothetical protein
VRPLLAAVLVAALGAGAWSVLSGNDTATAPPVKPQEPEPEPQPPPQPEESTPRTDPPEPLPAPRLGMPVLLFRDSLAASGWTQPDSGPVVPFTLNQEDEVRGFSNKGEARCRRELPARFLLTGRITLKPAWGGGEAPPAAGIRLAVPGMSTIVLWIEPDGERHRVVLGSDDGDWPPVPARIEDEALSMALEPTGSPPSGTAAFSILRQDDRVSILFGEDLASVEGRREARLPLLRADGACSVDLFVRDATAVFEQFELRQ